MRNTAFMFGVFLATSFALGEARPTTNFEAVDTLAEITDASADAQAMLDTLTWEPAEFTVRCGPDEIWGSDAIVRFASPKPAGDTINDTVAMEWYAARNEAGEVVDAPAVVVIHEASSSMPIGRMIAENLSRRGVHGLMLHLPGFGLRRHEGVNTGADRLVERMAQGISDARRAHDAAAALPHIDTGHIAIQGTSLGGFVTVSAASLDDVFETVWVTVSGGRIDRVLIEGKYDAAAIRRRLEAIGYNETSICEQAYEVEPTRIASRITPSRFYLYTAATDAVVPTACSDALARVVGVLEGHHVVMPGNHYTAILFLPTLLENISTRLLEKK